MLHNPVSPLTGRPAGLRRGRAARGSLEKHANPLISLISVLAAVAALTLALVPPASHFLAGRARQEGELTARASLLAFQVSRRAWLLEEPGGQRGLAQILSPAASDSTAEYRLLLAPDGTPLMAFPEEESLPWPRIAHSAPVLVEDKVVAQVRVIRSLREELEHTALIALGCGAVGLLAFLLLRMLPMRLLDQAMSRAAYLAAHDTLTGLANRASFQERLARDLREAEATDSSVALLYLDLDRFKEVNDTLGHSAGDALLREIAHRMSQGLRASDTLARLGGDEFAIIQTGATQPEAATALAERLIQLLAPPVDLSGNQVSAAVSIGIALSLPGQRPNAAQLAHDADIAMYQAKQAGRGCHRLFAPEMNQCLEERRAMERDLRRALARQEFHLAYQPLVDLPTGRVIGAEALLRWNRPGHGPVPPDRFIPLAEESGLISQIGFWVLAEACREATSWPEHMSVAVNVSAVQFRGGGLAEVVEAVLRSYALPASRLELEITETALLQDTDEVIATLKRLRVLGVRIAMDDFGTGHSSLGYLSRFHFDKIKIDRSFVQAMAEDVNARAIIHSMVGLSNTLGIRAHAEGVEYPEQAEFLRQEGYAEVQGWLYGRPVPGPEFAARYISAPAPQEGG